MAEPAVTAGAAPLQEKGKRKSSVPVKRVVREQQETARDEQAPRPKKPRVSVAQLRQQIRELQARLDVAAGVHTADTNKLEWDKAGGEMVARYRGFVSAAARKIGVPKSFLLEGIEDGSITDWRQARRLHEEAIHRATKGTLPQA